MTIPATHTPATAAARLGVSERTLRQVARHCAHARDDLTLTDAVFAPVAVERMKVMEGGKK